MRDRSNQITLTGFLIGKQTDKKSNNQLFQYCISTSCTQIAPLFYLESPTRCSFCFFPCDSWTFCCLYSQIWASENLDTQQETRNNLTSNSPLPEYYCSCGPKNLKLLNQTWHISGSTSFIIAWNKACRQPQIVP